MDLHNHTETLVSVDLNGNQASVGAVDARMRGDGRYVVFDSIGGNLVAGDSNGVEDFFVRDMQTGITTRVSGPQMVDNNIGFADVGNDGSVTFSTSDSLVLGDTNSNWDVYATNMPVGVNSAVSVKEDATVAGTETAAGQIKFTDADVSDVHSILVTPAAGGYLGTFTPVLTESSGAGTVNWTYSVNDSAIQYLASGQSLTQIYTVTINDGHGGTASTNVTVTINGTNDAPVLNAAASVALNNEAVSNNLVNNGGFETGNTTGWSANSRISVVTSSHHSGNDSAENNSTSNSGTLSQAITTVSGQQYILDYWVAATNTSGSDSVSASWNGTQVASQSSIQSSQGYIEQTVLVTATGASSTLGFTLSDSSNGKNVFLDDVSLTGAASGGVGTVVSSVIGLGTGPNNVSDVDAGAKAGIAITGTTNGVTGMWFYSTDNGTTWSAFSNVAVNNALLLAADSSTRIYFQPIAGSSGTASVTFEAWDQSTGSAGSHVDASTTGGTSAFSTTSVTASVIVGTVTSGTSATLTTSTDNVFFTSGTNTVIATDSTLNSTDSIAGGSGSDTLSLKVTGSSAFSFNFGTMTRFTGFETVSLSQNPSKAVSLTFGNANIAAGQTLTVDGSADNSSAFTVNASGVTDGGNFTFIASGSTNNLSGGSGNDLFQFTNAEFIAAPTIGGNGGTDTIRFTTAANMTAPAFAHVSGIEVLQLGNFTNSVALGSSAVAAFGGAGHTLTIDDTAGGNLTADASAVSRKSADLLIPLNKAYITTHHNLTRGAGNET